MLSASATPTQKAFHPPQHQQQQQQQSSSVVVGNGRRSFERDGSGNTGGGGGLQPPPPQPNNARNPSSASAVTFAPRGSSLNPMAAMSSSAAGPGSFSSELRSQMMPLGTTTPTPASMAAATAAAAAAAAAAGSQQQRAPSRAELYARDKAADDDEDLQAAQTLTGLREALNRETKMKEGSENMLEALNNKKAKQSRDYRARVEAELNASNARIKELRARISEAQRAPLRPAIPTTPTRNRTADNGSLFQANGVGGGGGGGVGGGAGGGGGGGGGIGGPGGPGGTPATMTLRSPRSASRSRANSDVEDQQTESPTFALAELLQALEVEGLMPEYYVSKANSLVDLFKRHPTLKYDLVWSVFGLRMQVMLLSDSREVVAAGYRLTRYAISDVSSLKKIRALNTDYLIATSLIKDRKADVEREQALKLVRAFLDVKGGAKELSRAVVRTIAALAEHGEDRHGGRPAIETIIEREDRLRPICIETLAEILSRDPALLVASGGLAPLAEALSEGTYKAPEGLTSAFLFLLDAPQRRKYLQPGYGIESLFSPFTDQLVENQSLLKQNAKAIAGALKSWSGLMTLCMYEFRTIKALVESMLLPHPSVRETIIDLLYSLLRIKSPGWAQSYLAGRRLTTYGRVNTLKSTTAKHSAAAHDEDTVEQNFVEHYTSLLLAVFIRAGLLPTLLRVTHTTDNPTQKRKTTLLLGEVLKLASKLLPPSWSSDIQLLPELFAAAAEFGNENRFNASATVYQISSVSRTLHRSSSMASSALASSGGGGLIGAGGLHHHHHHAGDGVATDDHPGKAGGGASVQTDDATWRQMLVESGVLNSSNYHKWHWDVIIKIIEGPLQSGKRLDEAAKASKFLKRIMSFYRPFKYKFAEIKVTRNSQKYVRAGCALMNALIQSNEGTRFLADSKLLRQVAECLAQCDPSSGITAQFPMFAQDRLIETLCGGYFPMLGVLTSDPKGLTLLERWRMFNMMYHIVELKQRPDLIKLILSNFDYSINGHPRILLGKALTGGNVDIRIHATNALRKYAVRPITDVPSQDSVGDAKWAIESLVCQLYDPEIDVCATAVKILEKACNRKSFLEYIVQCRPSLDHLGEIGAPLLLRFLSTSIGYKYLDGLDYISNEMDDWFLGRNDTYVDLIEASLARAFMDPPDDHSNRMVLFNDDGEAADDTEGHVPPHFYRELTRTHEGCKLLSEKGHFEEFAATIREHGMASDDAETMTKVKGCLWAVGNVGSMELGAPFLEAGDVVERIVRIAQEHAVLSLRGTAFFVLGLVSRSVHGLEMLSELGWDANCDAAGNSLGFCLPTDLGRLFSLRPWPADRLAGSVGRLPESQRTERLPPRPAPATRPPLEPQEGLRDDSDEATVHGRVLDIVVDLCNTVLFKQAMNELIRLRQARRGGFTSVRLFRQVMAMLEYNHYRLPIRKVVTELFSKEVLRQVVFDEGDDEEDEEEDEEEKENDDDDEDEGDDDQQEEEDDGDEGEREVDSSSGDDGRTERQRSILDLADLGRDRRRRR